MKGHEVERNFYFFSDSCPFVRFVATNFSAKFRPGSSTLHHRRGLRRRSPTANMPVRAIDAGSGTDAVPG